MQRERFSGLTRAGVNVPVIVSKADSRRGLKTMFQEQTAHTVYAPTRVSLPVSASHSRSSFS